MTNPVTEDVREVRVCLLGFGTVVRRFLTMLRDADERVARESGVRFLISGATSRHGGFLDPTGMTAGALLGIVHVGGDDLPGPAVPAEELISSRSRCHRRGDGPATRGRAGIDPHQHGLHPGSGRGHRQQGPRRLAV